MAGVGLSRTSTMESDGDADAMAVYEDAAASPPATPGRRMPISSPAFRGGARRVGRVQGDAGAPRAMPAVKVERQEPEAEAMGSRTVLTPSRVRHAREKEALGASMALTPVRRSARNLGDGAAALTPSREMLEKVGFAYVPNRGVLGESPGAESPSESAHGDGPAVQGGQEEEEMDVGSGERGEGGFEVDSPPRTPVGVPRVGGEEEEGREEDEDEDEEGSPPPGSLMLTFSSGLTPGSGRPRGTPGGLARTSSLSTPVRSLSSTPGGVLSGGAKRVARTPTMGTAPAAAAAAAREIRKPEVADENYDGPMAPLIAQLAAQGKVLKLVDATKEQKLLLGSDKVLTPVRASGRGLDRALTPSRGDLQRMLSESNFAYVPDNSAP